LSYSSRFATGKSGTNGKVECRKASGQESRGMVLRGLTFDLGLSTFDYRFSG